MFTTLQTEIVSCQYGLIAGHSAPRCIFVVRTAPKVVTCWYSDSYAGVQFHHSFPAQAKLVRQGTQTYLSLNRDPKASPIKVEYSAELSEKYMETLMGSH